MCARQDRSGSHAPRPGCLTTVSSFVFEVQTLPRRTALLYLVASIALVEVVQVVIANGIHAARPDGWRANCS